MENDTVNKSGTMPCEPTTQWYMGSKKYNTMNEGRITYLLTSSSLKVKGKEVNIIILKHNVNSTMGRGNREIPRLNRRKTMTSMTSES